MPESSKDRPAPRALLLCACLLLAGCSGLSNRLQDLEPPRVELQQVALRKIDLLKPGFRLTLRVENPNDIDLEVAGADAVLSLDGDPVASSTSLDPVTLKARRPSTVEIQATAKTLALLRHVLALDERGSVDYLVEGHLQLKQWLGPLGRLPFSASGSLTREELLRGIEGFSHHGF